MKLSGFHSFIARAILMTVGCVAASLASAGNLDFEQHAYAIELNRCIDMLRPAMQASRASKISYDVQEIQLSGPWYQFEISVSVDRENGAERIDSYKVGCKSNRWIDSSELQVRHNAEQLPAAMELQASK